MAPRRRVNRQVENVKSPAHFGIRMDTPKLDVSFRENARRDMEPTRFFDVEALQDLGLYDEAKRLFDNI